MECDNMEDWEKELRKMVRANYGKALRKEVMNEMRELIKEEFPGCYPLLTKRLIFRDKKGKETNRLKGSLLTAIMDYYIMDSFIPEESYVSFPTLLLSGDKIIFDHKHSYVRYEWFDGEKVIYTYLHKKDNEKVWEYIKKIYSYPLIIQI